MFKRFNIYRGLPRNVYILFLVQVVNRFGDFVLPFMTLFLTKKLGLSFQIVGIIVMIESILSIPGAIAGGKFADQIGRKKTYIFAQTTAALALIPCAFITNPYVIVSFLLTSTFFNGAVRPSLNAIIADVLPPDRRQAGYSLQYLGINLGVSIGPIVAGFLFNNFLPMLFIGDALTSLTAVILFIVYIDETKPSNETEAAASKEKLEEGNVFQVLLRRPQILIFLVIYIIYSVVYTQHRFSLPLMLDNVYMGNGAEKFGFLMSVNACTVILLTVFITSFTRKLHALPNMIIAGVLYAVGFGMIGIIKSFPLFMLSTVLWTIGEILTVTNFGVYVANNSPANYRARFSAVGNLSWATGAALGTSLMGKYIDLSGIAAVWPLTFILSCIAVFFMMMLYMYSYRKGSL